MPISKAALLANLAGSGQEHVLADFDTLSPVEQASLASQVMSFTNVQWRHMNSILHDSLDHLNQSAAAPSTESGATAPHIAPPPAATIFDLPQLQAENAPEVSAIRAAGLNLIASGGGAVLLLAGGSGTRLGVTIPKGLFQCDQLVSGRSLFAYQCQRVRRMEQLAAAFDEGSTSLLSGPVNPTAGRGLLRLLVLTSDQNDAATQRYFREHHFFGLLPGQVLFFQQSSLPCYDEHTGKVLMEANGRICLAPGGNGGVYESLMRVPGGPGANGQGLLPRLQEQGVRYIQIFSVDNLLGRLGDPYFFGIAATRQAEVVVKTVPKVAAEERVGVFALTDGKWGVVEYTEIGTERAAARDPATGELLYNCGNIAAHCCSVGFLELAAKDMESSTFYHAARKSIPTVNGLAPAIKMEAFIFDEFRLAEKVPTRSQAADLPDAFQIMQVDRSCEFAPIKNADGAAADTPTTAAHLLLALHTRWVAEAIAAAPESAEDRSSSSSSSSMHAVPGYAAHERSTALQRLRDGVCQWEISPLVSYEGEALGPLVPQLIRRSLSESGVLALEEAAVSQANM